MTLRLSAMILVLVICSATLIVGAPAAATLVDELKARLSSGDCGQRSAAVISLLGLVQNGDRDERAFAGEALYLHVCKTRDGCARRPLVAWLKDLDPAMRAYCARVLGEYRDETAVRLLIPYVCDSSDEVRLSAVRALSGVTDERIVDPLLGLLDDPSQRIRYEAVMELAKYKQPKCVEPLIASAHDPDADVRGKAIIALGAIGGLKVLPTLIGALDDEDSSVRAKAAEVLGDQGSRIPVLHLISALRDPAYDVRRFAASSLGMIGDRRAVEPLIEALADPSEYVRPSVVIALGRLGDARAVPRLLQMVEDDPQGNILAIESLGYIGDPSPAETLFSILDDRTNSMPLRAEVAVALGGVRAYRAALSLISALGEGDDDLRGGAILALIELRDPRAFDALKKILEVDDPWDREHAAYALTLLDDPGLDEILMRYLDKGDFAVVSGANQYFIAHGIDRAVPLLIQALEEAINGTVLAEEFVRSNHRKLAQVGREWQAECPHLRVTEQRTYAKWGEARKK